MAASFMETKGGSGTGFAPFATVWDKWDDGGPAHILMQMFPRMETERLHVDEAPLETEREGKKMWNWDSMAPLTTTGAQRFDP